jgi:hypothetical protein
MESGARVNLGARFRQSIDPIQFPLDKYRSVTDNTSI